jgi:hypothetical protein
VHDRAIGSSVLAKRVGAMLCDALGRSDAMAPSPARLDIRPATAHAPLFPKTTMTTRERRDRPVMYAIGQLLIDVRRNETHGRLGSTNLVFSVSSFDNGDPLPSPDRSRT